jgi:hypothetical protein
VLEERDFKSIEHEADEIEVEHEAAYEDPMLAQAPPRETEDMVIVKAVVFLNETYKGKQGAMIRHGVFHENINEYGAVENKKNSTEWERHELLYETVKNIPVGDREERYPAYHKQFLPSSKHNFSLKNGGNLWVAIEFGNTITEYGSVNMQDLQNGSCVLQLTTRQGGNKVNILVEIVEDLSSSHLRDDEVHQYLGENALNFLSDNMISFTTFMERFKGNTGRDKPQTNAFNNVRLAQGSSSAGWDRFRSQLSEFYTKRWRGCGNMLDIVQSESWHAFVQEVNSYQKTNDEAGKFLVKTEDQLKSMLPDNLKSGNSPWDQEKQTGGWSEAYRYFSREKWWRLGEEGSLDRVNFYYKYVHRLKIGCPKSKLMQVWKSLGKVRLWERYVNANWSKDKLADEYEQGQYRSQGRGMESTAYEGFCRIGEQQMAENTLLSNYLENFVTKNLLGKKKKEKDLRKVVAAYLGYSNYLKKDKSYSLKVSNEIVDICSNLIDLQGYSDNGQKSDDDCFYVLLGIAMVFLPDFFGQAPGNVDGMAASDAKEQELKD